MFDAARLARCKQGAILLNVGRGSTVDCLALADAVHSGHLFGAALDVTDPEPLPSDHPLWSEPNVIITSHISGRFSLAKTLDNIVEIFIHNLKLYAAGQPVDNQVSRTTHYVSGIISSSLSLKKLTTAGVRHAVKVLIFNHSAPKYCITPLGIVE